jgi:hypothetical protein
VNGREPSLLGRLLYKQIPFKGEAKC